MELVAHETVLRRPEARERGGERRAQGARGRAGLARQPAAAREAFDLNRSVTGWLMTAPANPEEPRG